jgi:hypothetical protein
MFPRDIALAEQFGMLPEHAGKLMHFCQGVYKRKKLLLIVRRTRHGAVRQHYENPNLSAKPVTAKLKSNAAAKATATVASQDPSVIARRLQSYFPDYDLQGAYELRDTAPPTYYRLFTGNYVNFRMIDVESQSSEKVRRTARDENEMNARVINAFNQREPSAHGLGSAAIGSTDKNGFIQALNTFVCGHAARQHMFQHGAQDGFLFQGRPVLSVDDNGFLLFEPTGNMRAISNSHDLRLYYEAHRISWPYSLEHRG